LQKKINIMDDPNDPNYFFATWKSDILELEGYRSQIHLRQEEALQQ